jgi:hypothetical protein
VGRGSTGTEGDGDGDGDNVVDVAMLVDAALDDVAGEVVIEDRVDFVIDLVVDDLLDVSLVDLLDILLDDLFDVGDGLPNVLVKESGPLHSPKPFWHVFASQ